MNDKYISKIKGREHALVARFLGQTHQGANNGQQQQADNTTVLDSEAADDMDIKDPDFNFEGFVI